MKFRRNTIQNSTFVILLLVSVFIFILSEPALAGETTVTRSLSTSTPDAKSVFDVTLELSDIQVGGIVETLPDGFSFVSTTHPGTQTWQSGRNLVFSVIDEKEITYKVKASSSGSGTFEGKWDDILAGTDGEIASSPVTVKASGGSGTSGSGNLKISSSSTAADGSGAEDISEIPGDTEDLVKARKSISQAESSGAGSEREAGQESKSESSTSDIKSDAETETGSESTPFTSPAFLLLILGAAACLVNGTCKGGRR